MNFNDRKMFLGLLIGPVLAMSFCFGSAGTYEKGSTPLTVDFCYLVRHPQQFHNKRIRTQAILHRDPENIALYDPNCDDKATHTWVEYDEPLVSSSEDRKKLQAALCQHTPCPTGEARVTVVGQLSGPFENGYGHLNDYRFRFSIAHVEQAEGIR